MLINFKRNFPFIERLDALTADKEYSSKRPPVTAFKPKEIKDYFEMYKDYDLIRAPIDDLVESAVGQGFYTTVEKKSPILGKSKSKELVDEFNKSFNLDSLLPNITKCSLIAGFCPVETVIVKGPVNKNALKIIHPKTVVDIDEENGLVKRVCQQEKDEKGVLQKKWIPETYVKDGPRQIAWFVYGQIANDVRGTSFIRTLNWLLDTLVNATKDVDAILKRYISPLGVWKSRRSIEAIKQAALDRDSGEDIFLGNLSSDEMAEKVLDFYSVDPRVPFWEYIEYLDRRMYTASRANNLWYTKQVSEASADKIDEIVQRHVRSIQRGVKRSVEHFWYNPLISKNLDDGEIPKLQFGGEPTGVEDIQLEDYLKIGVEVGYVTDPIYFKILNKLVGENIAQEIQSVSGSAKPEEEDGEVEEK